MKYRAPAYSSPSTFAAMLSSFIASSSVANSVASCDDLDSWAAANAGVARRRDTRRDNAGHVNDRSSVYPRL